MTTLTDQTKRGIRELVDLVIYVQLMGSFLPDTDFKQIKDLVTETNDFIKISTEAELREKLPLLKRTFQSMAQLFLKRFPLKRKMQDVTNDFNEFFKDDSPVYTTGIEFGWLQEQMDLKALHLYKDIPYHFRIGLGTHKGNGSIEEDFLLRDAFDAMVKAKYYQHVLNDLGKKLKKEENDGLISFNQESYSLITNIKYQISAYCRITIISFYAFVEGFVNSVGYNYLKKNEKILTPKEVESLKGVKNDRFLPLKSKLEKYQALIRDDKLIKIIVTDPQQITEPFKTFFNNYEELRNSSMHYAPFKASIWMKPQEWLEKAIGFSQISTSVAQEFWKACYPKSDGPEYLGKIDYDSHMRLAIERQNKIHEIEKELNTPITLSI